MPGAPKRRFEALVLVEVAIASALWAQPSAPDSAIPASAVVIERAILPANLHLDRELVLWMISPEKHDRGPLTKTNPYTCPEWTLGSYYSGPTRISLLDNHARRIINTVQLRSSIADNVDEFYIPYRIQQGWYYTVSGVRKGMEGKPRFLELRDLKGDGIAAETAFYEAEACMGLPTTLIGYSPTQDKVIQYRTRLRVREFEFKPEAKGGWRRQLRSSTTETLVWVDYLFATKPIQSGYWKYDIDYSGRGGSLESYSVRYDPAHERFIGTLTITTYPDPPAR
jgi:hypothetical protein